MRNRFTEVDFSPRGCKFCLDVTSGWPVNNSTFIALCELRMEMTIGKDAEAARPRAPTHDPERPHEKATRATGF